MNTKHILCQIKTEKCLFMRYITCGPSIFLLTKTSGHGGFAACFRRFLLKNYKFDTNLVQGVLCWRCLFRLWKNKCVSRKPCKWTVEEWFSTKWTNESTKINHVDREPCKWRTACTIKTQINLVLLFLLDRLGGFSHA